MKSKEIKEAEIKEFIQLLKSLDEKHQMGLYLITEGLQMIKK